MTLIILEYLKLKVLISGLKKRKTSLHLEMLLKSFGTKKEVCILFADTNLGKSILSVQLGNSISKGEQIRGFKLGVLKKFFHSILSYPQNNLK